MTLLTRFKYFCIFMLLTCPLMFSQTTISVSQQIVDTDGQAWNNGTWSAYAYLPNGSTVSGSIISGNLSSTGVLTGSFYNTSTITPLSAVYAVNICPNTSAPCISLPQLIITTTTPFPVVIAPRFNWGSGNKFGYADVEVSNPIIGANYYNVISLTQRYFNGTTWTNSFGALTRTGGTSNNDNHGRVILVGGVYTYTFTGIYTTPPDCTASDNSAKSVVQPSSTTTTLTLNGTGTDLITYNCGLY